MRLGPVHVVKAGTPVATEQQPTHGDLEALRATGAGELRQQTPRLDIVHSLPASITRSPLWRPLARVRALRQALWPCGFDARALIAWQDLQRVPEAPAGTWRSRGTQPQFIVPCRLPAGWLHIRIKMTTDSRGRLNIYADSGQGFHAQERLGSCCVGKIVDRDFYVYLRRPIQAVRIDPLDGPGQFRVERVQFVPVSWPVAFGRGVAAKIKLLRQHGLTLRALRNGLRLLLRGRLVSCLDKVVQALDGPVFPAAGSDRTSGVYEDWRNSRQLTDADRERMRAEGAAMDEPPRISVIMPVYNAAERYLRLAIESVLRQTYPHWELCIADDQSSEPHVRPVLEEYARRDSRVRVTFRGQRGHIAAASNSALALATGQFVALLDHDDELAEQALFQVARAVVADRGLDMLYSDEDKLELDGRHVEPFFKPDWSPEYFLSYMYTTHLGVYRTTLVRDLGGFRSEFDTAQDYDLALRVVARSQRIGHIPDVLYHWRKLPTSTASGQHAKPHADQVALRAAQSYLATIGRAGYVEPGPLAGLRRVRYPIAGRPKVSIVIPSACQRTGDRKKDYYLGRCVESIARKSSYRNYEIIVVHNHDVPPALAARLARFQVMAVAYTAPFNLSAQINLGAAAARGEHLLLLNDDMEIITPEWLESMLEFSQQPEIGAVGCKLLYPDGRLQHVGVILYQGHPGHCYRQFPGDHSGYFCGNAIIRNYSAVTGACVMTRADVFRSLGGFDECFPLHYNDIDYCLKVATSGKRIVYTPYAALYHYESVSKPAYDPHETDAFVARWRDRWGHDPYYNPNLSVRHIDYRIEIEESSRDVR